MKCNHCNAEVPNGVRYCPYCGSPIIPQSQQRQYQQPLQGQPQQPQQEKPQQMKAIYWVYIGIALVLFYIIGTCDESDRQEYGSNSDYVEMNDNSDSYSSAPSWIQGTWYCVTPYGNMQVEITGDHILELPGDGSSYYGTYHISNNMIIPETGSHMYYKMEGHRLSAGQGYYFQKQ